MLTVMFRRTGVITCFTLFVCFIFRICDTTALSKDSTVTHAFENHAPTITAKTTETLRVSGATQLDPKETTQHFQNSSHTVVLELDPSVSNKVSDIADTTNVARDSTAYTTTFESVINAETDETVQVSDVTQTDAKETTKHFQSSSHGVVPELHPNVSSNVSAVADTTSDVIDTSDYATTFVSMTTAFEISTDLSEIGTQINASSDNHDSVCSVCQNCTDDYIDHVIADVTAHLPPFLELPNRQGRFQLYHGKLFGLNTLKRSEAANVTCRSADDYTVMVPLQIENAKAFYKWQVEMPLRTFYGDLNVTIAHTEARVFYSHHAKTGSLVENLEITALDEIETEFSGAGIMNSMFAGMTRTLISVFRGYFARTLENTLVHVINKELQDEKKYDKYYDTKN